MNFTPRGIFELTSGYDSKLLLLSYIVMFLGFGVKSALVPFHSWLPSAMVAPTPVSALLHAVAVVKSGIFSLMRITYFVFGASVVKDLGAPKFLVPFVVITVVMGSLLALHQDHLKKRLAYSTISQLGYMILGILLLNPIGLMGAMLQMINHAVIKITLFFIVGSITHETGKKYIHQINGLGKQMPVTFICFSIAAISLIGIPPTNGFVSKWFLGLGALEANNMFYVVILLLSAFLTAAYLLPITVTAFFTNQSKASDTEGVESDTSANLNLNLDSNKMMLLPIVILTFVIVMLGLFPNPVINFINPIISDAF
jgi:multicomponent Na+:H+ antiporter subunit D